MPTSLGSTMAGSYLMFTDLTAEVGSANVVAIE
jgi:hypothetical protein